MVMTAEAFCLTRSSTVAMRMNELLNSQGGGMELLPRGKQPLMIASLPL